MPLNFKVSFDSERFKRQVGNLVAKRIRPGLQRAVDYMAAYARLRLIEGVTVYLDEPTTWTQNAFAYRHAGDERTAASVVFVQEQQARALVLQVQGGERIAGSYATTYRGPILPGRDVTLDEHGNMPRMRSRTPSRRAPDGSPSRMASPRP